MHAKSAALQGSSHSTGNEKDVFLSYQPQLLSIFPYSDLHCGIDLSAVSPAFSLLHPLHLLPLCYLNNISILQWLRSEHLLYFSPDNTSIQIIPSLKPSLNHTEGKNMKILLLQLFFSLPFLRVTCAIGSRVVHGTTKFL